MILQILYVLHCYATFLSIGLFNRIITQTIMEVMFYGILTTSF